MDGLPAPQPKRTQSIFKSSICSPEGPVKTSSSTRRRCWASRTSLRSGRCPRRRRGDRGGLVHIVHIDGEMRDAARTLRHRGGDQLHQEAAELHKGQLPLLFRRVGGGPEMRLPGRSSRKRRCWHPYPPYTRQCGRDLDSAVSYNQSSSSENENMASGGGSPAAGDQGAHWRRRQRRATPSRNPETPGAAGPERPAPRRCRCGLPPAGSLPGRPGPPGGTPSPGGMRLPNRASTISTSVGG